MSRPALRVRNSGLRWNPHNQTDTPFVSRNRARPPDPGPAQIAHGGFFPNRSPL